MTDDDRLRGAKKAPKEEKKKERKVILSWQVDGSHRWANQEPCRWRGRKKLRIQDGDRKSVV